MKGKLEEEKARKKDFRKEKRKSWHFSSFIISSFLFELVGINSEESASLMSSIS